MDGCASARRNSSVQIRTTRGNSIHQCHNTLCARKFESMSSMHVYIHIYFVYIEVLRFYHFFGQASSFNPIDIPDYIKHGISVEKKHHVGIEINPTEIKTSDAVKSLYVHQRRCKNMDEGRLKLWPVYTQNMCSQECKFDRMLERCGCYPHFARPSRESTFIKFIIPYLIIHQRFPWPRSCQKN